MGAPGSGGLRRWLPSPLTAVGTAVDVVAARDGLSAAERELGRVLVAGARRAGTLRRLGLPSPIVLAGGADASPPVPADGTVLRGTPGAVPLADRSVDAVVVLGPTGYDRGTADEAARLLRPGGVVVLVGVDPSTLRGRGVRALSYLRGRAPTLLTPEEATTRMEAAGLDARSSREPWTYTAVGVAPRGSARS